MLAVGRWPLAVGRWPLAVGRWPLAVGLSFQLFSSSGCGSSSKDDEPAATDQASAAICAKLGARLVDDHVADLTMLSPADRAAQRATAEQSFGPAFMKTCGATFTVGQVRCALAADDSAEISACVAVVQVSK